MGTHTFITALSHGTEWWLLAPAEVFWRKEGLQQRAWGGRSGTARVISQTSLLEFLQTISVSAEKNLEPRSAAA